EAHIWPADESDVEQLVLHGTAANIGHADLAISEVFLDLEFFLAVPAIALAIAREDDLVSPHDFFLTQVQAPGLARGLQLRGAEAPLNPSVQLVNAVSGLPHRAQELEILGSVMIVIRHPPFFGQAKCTIEALHVFLVFKTELGAKQVGEPL